MFWFVTAVVIVMLAVIDLTTNLHLLVARRLRARAGRLTSTPTERLAQRAEAHRAAATIDGDTGSILRALAAVRKEAA
jgi:hypothetical protein